MVKHVDRLLAFDFNFDRFCLFGFGQPDIEDAFFAGWVDFGWLSKLPIWQCKKPGFYRG